MSLKSVKRKIVYKLVLVFIDIFKRISLQKARKISAVVGNIMILVLKKQREILYTNLAYTSFPVHPEKLIKDLVRNMMFTFAEFIKLAYYPFDKIKGLFDVKDEYILKEALKEGKGVILVTAHLGNWELLGTYLGKKGYKVNAIYRKPSNEDYDKVIRKFRGMNKVKLIENRDSWNGSIKALKNNEILIVLADQNPKNDSPDIPFLGKQAKTPKGPALFAIKTKAKILCSFVIRKKGRFEIRFIRPEYKGAGKLKERIISILTSINSVYSNIIKEYPDQWVWFHDRWGIYN